jgi:ubiquinone/menaquinone biosynthesis C-methylase UbiE
VERGIEAIAPRGLHEKVLELMQRLPGDRVLDAPTGYGALTAKLLAAGKRVTAGDIDTGKFRLGADPLLDLLRVDLNAERLPLEDAIYDVAVCAEGIEHLQCQWNLVRNLYRVLKPGGFLILTTPNILNFGSRLRYFWEGRYEHFKRPLVKGKSWSHDLENYHIAPISFFELQFILESCGFGVVAVDTNRYASKSVLSMLLRPLFRLMYRYKDFRDRKRDRGAHGELYETVVSDAIFYGECLVVLAQKPA